MFLLLPLTSRLNTAGLLPIQVSLWIIKKKNNISFHLMTHSKFKSNDANVSSVKLNTHGLLSVPRLTIFLMGLIRQQKPSFIINTLWLPGGLATFLALFFLRLKIPYSITLHGMEIVESDHSFKHRVRKKLSFLKTLTLKNAHKVICVSQFTKHLAEKILGQQNRQNIYVVHNGINPKKFKLLTQTVSDHKNDPKILSVCRLQPHKGIDQVLKSLPEVINHFPRLLYTVVGDGPDKNRLIELSQKLLLQNHVQFLGSLPQPELERVYSDQDLFVLLSRQENHHVEGFGLVFLEAALYRLPSLGGLSGGVPEAIEDGVTGWLVDPNDVTKIRAQLISILSQPSLIKSMGQTAYDKTREHKTWDKSFSKMFKILELQ